MFLTILTLFLSGNSTIWKCVFDCFAFCGSKMSIRIKIIVGAWKYTENKGFYMHNKNYKNATNEISDNEKKKWFFDIFRLGKPRVPNLITGIDSLRNFTSIMYFWKFFFYRLAFESQYREKIFLFEENGEKK